MPSSYLKKYERCVKSVKKKSPKYNPWAVCRSSVKHKQCPDGSKFNYKTGYCNRIRISPKKRNTSYKQKSRPKRRGDTKTHRKVDGRLRKLYTGPRGGKYYIKGGRKVYV